MLGTVIYTSPKTHS